MPTRKSIPTKLSRKKLTVQILGEPLDFLEPSVIQRALIFEFIVRAGAKSELSPDNISKLTREQLVEQLAPRMEEYSRLSEASQNGTATAEQQIRLMYIIGSLFSDPSTNSLLYQAICECFPQITEPFKLSDEAIYQVFAVLMEKISPSQADTAEIQNLVNTAI